MNLKDKYYFNFTENIIIKHYNQTYLHSLYNRCILDVSLDDYWVDFYLDYFDPCVVTTIGSPKPFVDYMKNKYSDQPIVEILNNDIQEHIGIFEKQFDVVNVIDIMFRFTDDYLWKTSIRNLCFYLKPGGLLFISGNFEDNTFNTGSNKFRSLKVWKRILNIYGCQIEEVYNAYTFGNDFSTHNLLVVKKNEKRNV